MQLAGRPLLSPLPCLHSLNLPPSTPRSPLSAHQPKTRAGHAARGPTCQSTSGGGNEYSCGTRMRSSPMSCSCGVSGPRTRFLYLGFCMSIGTTCDAAQCSVVSHRFRVGLAAYMIYDSCFTSQLNHSTCIVCESYRDRLLFSGHGP
jgi:hypothetical protein